MDLTTAKKEMQKNIEVFCCYAHKDQSWLQELKNHLAPLKRGGLITLWADTDINAGVEWEKEIHLHLNTSHIILLLVSPDFMASDYCYSKEMTRAMERHENGEARVIPIILRPVDWQVEPLSKLQALPTDGKPIISRSWHTIDEALFDVVQGIRKTIENLSLMLTSEEPEVDQPFPQTEDKGDDSSQTNNTADKTLNEINTPLNLTPLFIDQEENHYQVQEYSLIFQFPYGHDYRNPTSEHFPAFSRWFDDLSSRNGSIPKNLFTENMPQMREWIDNHYMHAKTNEWILSYQKKAMHITLQTSQAVEIRRNGSHPRPLQASLKLSDFALLDQIIKVGQQRYLFFQWHLINELNVGIISNEIYEQTGRKSSSSTSDCAEYVFYTPPKKRLEDTHTHDVTIRLIPTGICLLYKGGFYQAHTYFSPVKIISILRGNILYKQAIELIEDSCKSYEIGVEDNTLNLHLEPVQVLAAVESAMNMLALNIEQKIMLDVDANLWVNADRMCFRQILSNLLDNAAKYSPTHSSIHLSACAMPLAQIESLLPQEQINSQLVVERGHIPVVLMRVQDQGEGVLSQDKLRIFEKFVQAQHSLTTSVRGSGLGLYVSRHHVEAMGGKLWLEQSAPKEGSTFSFYLPYAEIPIEPDK